MVVFNATVAARRYGEAPDAERFVTVVHEGFDDKVVCRRATPSDQKGVRPLRLGRCGGNWGEWNLVQRQCSTGTKRTVVN